MPRLSVWFIRTALVYLLAGATLGALLLASKGVQLPIAVWGWLPGHIEFVLFGWIIQLAMGVAFWILPRFSDHPKRGNERLAWAAYGLLNGGIWLMVAAGMLAGAGWLRFAGRGMQAAAALVFGLHAWPRVKPMG